MVDVFKRRISRLEERLDTNSTNSSKPPSPDARSVKRRPPVPHSGKKREDNRDTVAVSVLSYHGNNSNQMIECKPSHCRKMRPRPRGR